MDLARQRLNLPWRGTANRIVPLGEAYLELVAIVDEAEAAQSPFGRWVAAAHPTLPRPLGWAVRTPKLDDFARRLDLTVAAGSRAGRSGQLVRWRLAGIEQATAEPSLPFYPSLDYRPDCSGGVGVARLHGGPDRAAAWRERQGGFPRDALYPVPWPPSASPHHANAPRYFVSVSQQNVEAMRSLLESYVQGDYGPALDALDPDVELWLDPQTFPESGPFRGRQAVIARLTEVVSSFDDYWASAEGAELIDAGDWVVIVTDLGAPTA